jgi:hypothetical protein
LIIFAGRRWEKRRIALAVRREGVGVEGEEGLVGWDMRKRGNG